MNFFKLYNYLILLLSSNVLLAQCPDTTINCVSFLTRNGTVSSQPGAGATAWTNPGNAAGPDGSVATIGFGGLAAIANVTSRTITASSFGFNTTNLPTYKYVCGIGLTITRGYTVTGTLSAFNASDNTITVGGGANLSTGAAWASGLGTATFGGIGTGAGTSPTAIHATGFGATLSANISTTTINGSFTARLDGFAITIYTHDTVITPCPLPVTLKYFKGRQERNCINLSWLTESEVFNDYFIIEKLVGESYIEIARIDSKASSGEQKSLFYDFTDCQISKMNYYRLVQMDVDGKREIAGKLIAVPVDVELEDAITIVPNPAQDFVCVSSQYPLKQLQLYSSDGRLMKSEEVTFFSEQSCLDLTNYQKGIYSMIVTTTQGTYSKRLVLN